MTYAVDILGASTAAPSLADVRAGRAVIKQGMAGESVTYVQALVGVVADGVFGPATKTAVEAFQSAATLPVDGVVGKNTMASLDSLAGGTGGVSRADFSQPEPNAAANAAVSRIIQEASAAKQPVIPPTTSATVQLSESVPAWKWALGGLGIAALGLGVYKAVN